MEWWRASFLNLDVGSVGSMEPLVYELPDTFYNLMLGLEEGEPILVTDRVSRDHPRRLFLVRYLRSEVGSGETTRPIFRNELTGYDYETRLTYPTQREHLDMLQSTMESYTHGSSQAQLFPAVVQNMSTRARTSVRVIASEHLFSMLVGLYEFAW
jgi:hypothetical protein